MKLYLVSQDQNNEYDSFDSMVVAAPDEESARDMQPTFNETPPEVPGKVDWEAAGKDRWGSWAFERERVKVEYLGEAKDGTKAGVICASFNAG